MKRLLITLCLCILLLASMMTVTALYISGPSIKYDVQIQEQIDLIKEQNKEEYTSIDRHVFRYITYIAKAEDEYIWFDKDAKELLRRKIDKINFEDALKKVVEDHSLDNITAMLGYGYEQAVYVVENHEYMILLDIDTLQEIYYQRK